MIGFLKGKLLFKQGNILIIDVSGVGYEVQVPQTIAQKFTQGLNISLWIYSHVREDAIDLCGFSSAEEKQFFLSLIKINGIGPKMALSILGTCSIEQFAQMIKDENIKALKALPRVGTKMAQQIVLALKKQVPDILIGQSEKSQHNQKVTTALESLGYTSKEIYEALSKMKMKEDLQEDIKEALSHLNGSR